MPTRNLGPLVMAALLVLACPSTQNVNGALSPNQRPVLEGGLWTDARCSEGEGHAHCCERNGPYCLGFTDYNVGDVRVQGNRVAALISANNGYILALSDDRGDSWRTVPLGSVGGLAAFRPMALHLDEREVYLMVPNQEDAAGGGTVARTRPVRVDLASGQTTPVASDWFLFSRLPAAVKDGASVGVSYWPEDARGGATCTADLETWKPGQPPVRARALFTGPCNEGMEVPASNDGRLFPLLADVGGLQPCLFQYDAALNTVSKTCVPASEWPALSEPRVLASYADERAEYLRAFTQRGLSWAASPSLASPIPLGPGLPKQNRGTGGRQRYAGFVVLGDATGGSTLVRLRRDGGVDDVLLPRSPCAQNPEQSCFDPKNPGIWHGEYGDALWIEPLGGDEFLVFWLHDLAPGLNQYKGLITTSRERAAYRPRDGLVPYESLGPPGYPKATRAGAVEELCAKRLTCTPIREDFYQCVNRFIVHDGSKPNIEAALAAARSATCDDPVYTEPKWLDCLSRGGTPSRPDGGPLLFQCDFRVSLAGAACGTCISDVAVACTGSSSSVVPLDCASGGFTCQAGTCKKPGSCGSAGSTLVCNGDRAERCWNNSLESLRCDLLNMACDTNARPNAWNPCVSKQGEPFSTVWTPLRCEGRYLLWDLNGTHWADCRALGFSGCQGDRCVR
ncbi:hypothetical protein [Archangium lansingense]|uniref:BNR repeat domain protein n=1 Tax=Archangium lansingense TaxID=2995310 RepID=A0ABT4A2Y9_9BACT|nr:hypothetical protein [Archangium lansinium]MCY1076017.1 hypothetical protein [Archangium lansinium]